MDNEFAARVLASLSATNAEAKKYEVSWFSGQDVADALHLGKSYAALKATLTSGHFWGGLWDVSQDYFKGELSVKTGLQVEEISEAGVAQAIGRRAGFDLHSLHDVDVIQRDLLRVAADRIGARMGWTFDEVIDTPQQLIDALVAHAGAEVEKRVEGLTLDDLRDAGKTLDTVKRWAAGRIKARTGIPMNDVGDVQKTQAGVLRWAEVECRRRIGAESNPNGVKMTKKAIKNRLAQRKFYAAHGDRHVMPSVKG